MLISFTPKKHSQSLKNLANLIDCYKAATKPAHLDIRKVGSGFYIDADWYLSGFNTQNQPK